MSVTIRDVARLAGVSPSTVSRVLNNKGVISDDTAQRIQKAMRDLNYVPNDFARGFANGTSRSIAIVIDVVNEAAYSNDFFNDTVFGIETAAHKNDYSLMVTNGANAFGGIASVERLVLGKKIDGIIIPDSIAKPAFLKKLAEIKFPCVILGHHEDRLSENSWVDINNTQAGSLAVRHLYQKGYRRIAFLSSGDQETFNKDRLFGYCRELQDCGLPFEDSLVAHQLTSLESGKQQAETFLNMVTPPDAMICSNDRLALGVLRAARDMNVSVPEQLGILCFDDTSITELAEPSITSMDVDTYELGVQAAEILIDQIEAPDSNLRQILLSTKIIERESTQGIQGKEACT